MNKQDNPRRRAAAVLASCGAIIASTAPLLARSGTHGHTFTPTFFYGIALGVFAGVLVAIVLRVLGVGPCGSNCSRRLFRK